MNSLSPDPWTLCVSRRHFAQHLEVVNRLSPRPVVTFDDGYADNLLEALPLLERYDVPARFFVVSGAVGSPKEMWWDDLERLLLHHGEQAYFEAFHTLRPLPFDLQQQILNRMFQSRNQSRDARPGRRMLTASELCELAASPIAEIGAHTVTHPVLSSLDIEAQRREIAAGKLHLESILNRPIQGFSYPNGMSCDYTDATRGLVQQAGFSYAYSAFEHALSDPFQLPRVMIRDWDGEEFERVLHQAVALD